MQRQSNHLHIKVETCCNCHLHSWCTRHDQSKYNAFYQKFQTMIKSHLPKAVISRNQPPAHYQRVYDSPEGPDRYIDQNNYQVSYPRSGAFQISVNGVQIFSKLKSSLWPSIDRVVKLIMNVDKDIKQQEDIQKYSLQYRLQNDHDFSFVQTYRAELKRKQMVKVFTHDNPISSGGNRSFKSRRLFSNSKTKKKTTQPEQSSPIINSRKFQGSNLIKLNQNIHQLSDFNDEQQERQINKWNLKDSHKKQQQNIMKKSPILITKSKVMQKLKNKSGILKDNKAKQDQINLHRLIDEKLDEGQSKNSSKLNNTKKVEVKGRSKDEDESGGKLKGWSDKQQKSKSDFVINETSNSLKDKRQQGEMKKKPSINQKLQEKQEEDYQFILEQSQGQQNMTKNGKSNKDQQKMYLKPKDQDQKSYAESNDKKILHIEQTFSQKSLDIKNYYQIYEKIANWQAVYTESQEDYEVYQFTLLLMSKNFESQPSNKHEIQSYDQFEQQNQQNLDVFRVKQVEVKQIKYKQLLYYKYAQINWNTKYKNGYKLTREGEEDMQSFCEEILDDNQIDEVKIQQVKKVQNHIDKNKQRKQKQEKQAAQLKKFHQAVSLKMQTAYQQGENWVALYQNDHFILNKNPKKYVQPAKYEKPIPKSAVINIQDYKQQKWICEYSNKRFQLSKMDKPNLSTYNTDQTKIQVRLQNKQMEVEQQLLNMSKYQEEKWIGEYENGHYKLQRRNNHPKPELREKYSGEKLLEIKKEVKVENKNKDIATHTALESQNKQKGVAEHPNGQFLLKEKQNEGELKDKVETKNNQVNAEIKKEKKQNNSQKSELKKESQNGEVYKSDNWVAEYSKGGFQLFKQEQKQKAVAPAGRDSENKKEDPELSEAKKNNSEQVSKKIQSKEPPEQPIQIPKKAAQLKKEAVSEAHNNQSQKKKQQAGTNISPESMLWIAQYQGIEFILKKDRNNLNQTKTEDKKNSSLKKSYDKSEQEKKNKINKNEQKNPNIISWTGKYKNNQFVLQKFIKV